MQYCHALDSVASVKAYGYQISYVVIRRNIDMPEYIQTLRMNVRK